MNVGAGSNRPSWTQSVHHNRKKEGGSAIHSWMHPKPHECEG